MLFPLYHPSILLAQFPYPAPENASEIHSNRLLLDHKAGENQACQSRSTTSQNWIKSPYILN
jgi:hypothetical protein